MGNLDGKVALITGGARGQGRAIATRFAAEGAKVAVCDLASQMDTIRYSLATKEDLKETARAVELAGGECLALLGDVRKQADLDSAVAGTISRFGKVDILVAQAGVVDYKPFWEISEEEWHDVVDVNMSGAWRAAKAVAPHMIERGSGVIIFTSSVAGVEAGWDYMHYVAAKHGVIGIMKAASLELGPFGIRSNAVLPGPVDTIMNDNPTSRAWMTGREGATREDYLRVIPPWFVLKGRTALPLRAITDAMTWLASDQAEFVTGLELLVDAGHTLLPGVNFKQTIDESAITELL